MRSHLTQALLVCTLLALGCSHDLAALKRGKGGSGSGESGTSAAGAGGAGGASGTSAAGAGGAGSGGQSSTDGGPAGTGGALDSCQPCVAAALDAGSAVPLEPCCTGTRKAVCGVSFDRGLRCYERNVPGSTDTTCPEVTRGGTVLAGCCRVDSQCGVDIVGLGCVARADVPAALGGPLTPRSCLPVCKDDAYCQKFSDAYLCAQNPADGARFCALSCQHDPNCAGTAGNVCVLQNNTLANRVDAICRKPIGTGAQNDPCASPNDCIHGACATDKKAVPPRNFCTQLCGSDADCVGTFNACLQSSIPVPDKTTSQLVRICLNTK